jgi:hypothetical protein
VKIDVTYDVSLGWRIVCEGKAHFCEICVRSSLLFDEANAPPERGKIDPPFACTWNENQ